MKKISVAILGFGTVGSGVAQVLEENRREVAAAADAELEVKRILDVRDFPDSPYRDRLTRDMDAILEDPEVQLVCETMGGLEPAFAFTRAALERGKSVCTSNKELVDAHGGELTAVARAHDCAYLFEASVGGGIPLLRTLRDSLRHEKIASVVGILNGTCNYILTRMEREGMEFADALRQAQENGFAERNPAADVEGHDTARKLAILASLLSGRRVRYEDIPCQGITGVTRADLLRAKEAGRAVKLLGVGSFDGDSVSVMVAPCLVPPENPLWGVSGVFNGVLVQGNAVGDVMLYGRGAGSRPTASAVAADLIECVRHGGRFIETGLPGPEGDTHYHNHYDNKSCDLPGGLERL